MQGFFLVHKTMTNIIYKREKSYNMVSLRASVVKRILRLLPLLYHLKKQLKSTPDGSWFGMVSSWSKMIIYGH